jgi:uncharacterized membrane protein YciS (DUF1049 family)
MTHGYYYYYYIIIIIIIITIIIILQLGSTNEQEPAKYLLFEFGLF